MEGNTETDDVTISRDAAMGALAEVVISIRRTGGDDPENGCSPLALARQRVEDDDRLDDDARTAVLDILASVANERGEEITDVDPLVDRTFTARRELERELGLRDAYDAGDGANGGEEPTEPTGA